MFYAASGHGSNSESAAENDLPTAFIYSVKIGSAKAIGSV